MQDAGVEAQRLAHNLLCPAPFGCWESRNTVAVRHLDVRRSYLRSRDDISLPPGDFAWFPRFSDRLGEHDLVEADGSHESCFSRPAAVADAVPAAARLTGRPGAGPQPGVPI